VKVRCSRCAHSPANHRPRCNVIVKWSNKTFCDCHGFVVWPEHPAPGEDADHDMYCIMCEEAIRSAMFAHPATQAALRRGGLTPISRDIA